MRISEYEMYLTVLSTSYLISVRIFSPALPIKVNVIVEAKYGITFAKKCFSTRNAFSYVEKEVNGSSLAAPANGEKFRSSIECVQLMASILQHLRLIFLYLFLQNCL